VVSLSLGDGVTNIQVRDKIAPPALQTGETSIVVPIGGINVSSDPHTVLLTYALGSCVALLMYDGLAHIAGLTHVMLPASRVNTRKGTENPGLFADTAVPALLQALEAAGAQRPNLVAKVVGGAEMLSSAGSLAIGARNVAALETALAAASIPVAARDVGGRHSRSVEARVADGIAVVTSGRENTAL
jgi:chemotaxis protein CheD